MENSILSYWKYRNLPVTRNDTSSLVDLSYYLNCQLKFMCDIKCDKKVVIEYIDDIKVIERILRKCGVEDSSVKSYIRHILMTIEQSIDKLKVKYGI